MGWLSKRVLLLVGGISLSGCVVDPVPYDRPVAQSDAEIKFVKSMMGAVQTQSFETGREYCGYVGLDADGNYVATPPKRGRKNSCRPDDVPDDFTQIASYHTHGSYSEDHDSEIPSVEDIEADIYEGHDGYIATPGGRIWFIDGYKMTAKVLCGENCVRADENYVAEVDLDTGRTYTLAEIERLLAAED